jgi:hypothetical protein
MKRVILTITLVVLTLVGYSQVPSTDVVSVDTTITKDELFGRGMAFFANTFKSAKDVIQLSEPVSGKIVGKGIVGDKKVMITIDCKDGKYRYDIDLSPKLIIDRRVILRDRKYAYCMVNTHIKVTNEGGTIEVPLSDIVIKNGGFCSKAPDISYYEAVNSNFMKNWFSSWKEDVQSEISKIKKEYSDNLDPNSVSNQRTLSHIIELIKTEMGKEDNW